MQCAVANHVACRFSERTQELTFREVHDMLDLKREEHVMLHGKPVWGWWRIILTMVPMCAQCGIVMGHQDAGWTCARCGAVMDEPAASTV